MKIDKRKKYVLVVDVETTNNTNITDRNAPNDGLCYDVGYGVYDKQGNEHVAKSYAVSEIFFDKDLMDSAYYKDKLPKYYEELKKGTRQVKNICAIRKEIKEVVKKYDIKEIYAYNASFDNTTLNNTIRLVTGSMARYFFPFGTEFCDIWHIACQVLGLQKTFQWENIRNEKGNLKTSAERMFAYMSNDENFEEEHIGLADVRIEAQILARCFKSHKSINKKINRACWRIPQKASKKEA